MRRGLFGLKSLRAVLILLGVVLLWAGPALAYSISGTITNNTGNTGRVYLKVMWEGGGETLYGTSIDLAATSSFTIQGLDMDGSFVVGAFLDEAGIGVPYTNSALGQSSPVNVAGGVVSGPADVTIAYPLSTPTASLQSLDIIPGDGMLLVFVKPDRDSMGFFNADHFDICYDTDPNSTTPTCPTEWTNLPVTGEEVDLALTGQPNDTAVYFWATPYLGGASGTVATNSGTPSAPGTGQNVSGTVTLAFSGTPAPIGSTVYVALANDQVPGVVSPTILIKNFTLSAGNTANYTLTGIPDGYYNLYLLVDLNNNGVIDLGEPRNTNDNVPLVEIAGQDISNEDLTLTDSPLGNRVSSQNQIRNGLHNYNLDIQLYDGSKRPAAIAFTGGGPLGTVEHVDLGLSQWGTFEEFLYGLSTRPQNTDIYTFAVTYTDGSTGTYEVSPDIVLDTFATSPFAPAGYILSTRPDFSWGAAATTPQPFYNYFLQLWSEQNGYEQLYPAPDTNIDDYYLPAGTTSLPYPLLNDLNYDQKYEWMISVIDRFGNQASVINEFTPVTELPAKPITHIGIFRSGKWYLDVDDSQTWDPLQDILITFGKAGDIPVVGDWDGTGTMRVGVVRNNRWYLDMDNDHVFDPLTDATFTFGKTGDIPVVGDWDGTGTTRVGVFRNGKWYLDMNNDHSFDLSDTTFSFGKTGDVPVVGDWDGTGTMKVGVVRNNRWYLDMNNDHVFDLSDTTFSFGITGDIPVVGDWDGTGTMRVGIFRNGKWFLDLDNDHAFDPLSDAFFTFGKTGDIPLTVNQ